MNAITLEKNIVRYIAGIRIVVHLALSCKQGIKRLCIKIGVCPDRSSQCTREFDGGHFYLNGRGATTLNALN